MLVLQRFARVLTLVFAVASPLAVAHAETAAQGHNEAIQTESGKFVQNLGNTAIGIIADKTVNASQRNQKFRDILRNSFDLQTIGRFVIGRSWNSANPAQQKEYMELFEGLVIKSYGDRLTIYTGEGFTVTGVRPESEKDSIVTSQITHPDGSQPTAIDWRVRKRDGKLGVIDVVVEGVSLSVTQRQEYSAIIQRDNGKLDGLLSMMRDQLNGKTPNNAG